ncbi:sulfurtransferase [Agrobacterium tumefaciens]|uniref:Sulfurtransferase n=1 Tax=Agrobacterium tumefaciens TaxID=358 RepID=A0AA44EYP1_AGRTU|nr:sulfurtransferase [Agrobacterium tumefaciens]NSL23080.1 sulfurtransferase [Agrobacterium tumefaciens]NTB89667.1 sulfurtransferase [Agrobacterium tumefaciens]NTC15497.1 sulfurtransferase [Agrobacterium tumefaciens]NTC26581.1 sulfurtransferase [Agrobacterium tumefaciens]NTC58137.1 sulfurtransferase [Agrobacterium tumefaciens]
MTSNPSLRPSNLISADNLATALDDGSNLVLLDVRFTPGKPGRRDSYLEEHIPGARYIDLPTELADPVAREQGRGSNPLPRIERLAEDLRRLGVSNGSRIVVYDDTNGAPAARAWWTLTWAGLTDVKLLDGGLAGWKASGRTVETGEGVVPSVGGVELIANKLPSIDADQVASLPADTILVDVRPASSFRSEGNGHIPGAKSFPVDRLIGTDGTLISPDELKQKLKEADIDVAQPVAAYCGGGIASSLFTLALSEIGKEVTLYPGSWSEWTIDKSRPVEL